MRGARVSAVVVVGSLHYDIMVDAPDRPRKGETVAGLSWSPKFGGKGGNQALAAEGQGVPTAMVGAVGGDDFGSRAAGRARSRRRRSLGSRDLVGCGFRHERCDLRRGGRLRRGDCLRGESSHKRDTSSRRVVANREGPDPPERDSGRGQRGRRAESEGVRRQDGP